MAKLVTRPQRFTPEEWKLASKVKHKNTERDRAATERLILECDRLDGEGRGTVDRTLADVNKKLGEMRAGPSLPFISLFSLSLLKINVWITSRTGRGNWK